MRVAPGIELSSEARLELEKLSRRRTTPVRVVQRSRIILLAADGAQNKEIAERLGVAPRMAALWRSRLRSGWAWRHAWRRFGGAGLSSWVSQV